MIGGEKSWWTSRTIWGGLTALVAGLSGAGLITVQDQADLTQVATAGASVLGGLLAIWGRWTATRSLR